MRVAALFVAAASALLLFAAGASATSTALYDQNDNFSIPHAFGTTFNSIADDFVVPPSTSWHITQVFAAGGDYGNLNQVTVKIYNDSSGTPGATAVYTVTAPSSGTGAFTDAPDAYWTGDGSAYGRTRGDLTVPVDVTLTAGHYWLSVIPNNQWWWNVRGAVSTTPAMMIDTSGFNFTGTGCTTWSDIATCYGYTAHSMDLMFTLYGTSQTVNPLTGSTGNTLTAIAGKALSNATLGTFTDSDTTVPASSFTAQVCWSDAATTPPNDCGTATVTGSAGSFSVTGSHTFTAAGSYNATTTVTDAANNHAEIDTTITVTPSAADRIATLKTTISGMGLAKGTASALNDILNKASAGLAASNTTYALSEMKDFLNYVKAQTGKKITTAQAAQLTTAAQSIIAAINGSS